MKKYYVLLITIILVINNIGFIYSTTVESDDEIYRAVGYLNNLRVNVGVNELSTNEELKLASLVHTKYMYYNDSYSSIEESSKLYYRGKYPVNRASYYSYEKPYVYELINNTSETYNGAINDYINNPYSRTVLFDPVYDDIGMGNFEGLYTFNFGGENRVNDKKVVYPFDGQVNVPTIWKNTYEIDPYKQLGLNDDYYGLPITYTYYSDKLKVDRFQINEIELVNTETDTLVDYEIITSDTDKYLKNTIVILPLEAYTSDVKYEINMDFKVYFTDYTSRIILYNGDFVTGVSYVENEKLLTRAKCTEEIIKSLGVTLLEPFFITFHDVDIKAPTAKYIYTAYVLGIVQGYDEYNTIFSPFHNISKEQVYTMIIRAYEKKIGEIEYDKNEVIDYSDKNEISEWVLDEKVIEKADELGIILSDENNNLNPKDYITENEFNEVIEKLDNLINGN